MPLPPPSLPRQRIHTREIRHEGFKREDGAYEVDARMTDIKDFDYALVARLRRAAT